MVQSICPYMFVEKNKINQINCEKLQILSITLSYTQK